MNVKHSNSQLKKLKSGIKNGTEVTLNFLSNTVNNYNDEANFLHKLLLINTKVSKIGKAFANGSSTYINFLKTHLSQIIKLGRLLDATPQFLLSPKNVVKKLMKIKAIQFSSLTKEINKNELTKMR